jgi:hypothetical protein
MDSQPSWTGCGGPYLGLPWGGVVSHDQQQAAYLHDARVVFLFILETSGFIGDAAVHGHRRFSVDHHRLARSECAAQLRDVVIHLDGLTARTTSSAAMPEPAGKILKKDLRKSHFVARDRW